MTNNIREFLHFVDTAGLDMVYNDLYTKKDVQPIIVTFYGKTIEIDCHADNYCTFVDFLQKVIEND